MIEREATTVQIDDALLLDIYPWKRQYAIYKNILVFYWMAFEWIAI